jgi:hypothetical protein
MRSGTPTDDDKATGGRAADTVHTILGSIFLRQGEHAHVSHHGLLSYTVMWHG